MKASELRIGNLITDEYVNFLTVKAIPMEHRNFIEAKGKGNLRLLYLSRQDKMIGWSDFEKNSKAGFKEPIATPIPLTEEWLINFSFDDSEYKTGYIGKDFKMGTQGLIGDFVLTKPKTLGDFQDYYVFELRQHRIVLIEHVHQLQNLYFAMTGEELTTKQQ